MFSCWCFRYPSQHVYCSEQNLSGPDQSAGDKDPHGHKQEQEQDSTQHKVCGGVIFATQKKSVILIGFNEQTVV